MSKWQEQYDRGQMMQQEGWHLCQDSDEMRCPKVESYSRQRCNFDAGHDGRHELLVRWDAKAWQTTEIDVPSEV